MRKTLLLATRFGLVFPGMLCMSLHGCTCSSADSYFGFGPLLFLAGSIPVIGLSMHAPLSVFSESRLEVKRKTITQTMSAWYLNILRLRLSGDKLCSEEYWSLRPLLECIMHHASGESGGKSSAYGYLLVRVGKSRLPTRTSHSPATPEGHEFRDLRD